MSRRWLRRRKLWVHSDVQLRIVLFSVVSATVLGLFMFWFTFVMLWRTVSEMPYLSERLLMGPQELLRDIGPSLLPGAFIIFGLVLLCVAGMGLILSHQIGGPIYRLKKTLEEIREGNYETRMRLRRLDSLKDVEVSVNETADALKRREVRRTQALKAAQAALAALPDRLDQEIRLSPQQQEQIRNAREVMKAAPPRPDGDAQTRDERVP